MALWRIRATVDDRPGFLAVLAASLALRKVNILSVQVHASQAGAVDDFLVDAPETLSETELLAAVVKGRGREGRWRCAGWSRRSPRPSAPGRTRWRTSRPRSPAGPRTSRLEPVAHPRLGDQVPRPGRVGLQLGA